MDDFEKEIKELGLDATESTEQVIDEVRTLDNKAKKDDSIYTSFFETRDFIYEQVVNADVADVADGKTEEKEASFIKYNKKNDAWERVDSFKYQNKTYKPIIDEIFLKNGVCLPSDVEEYKNSKEIIDNIKKYLRERIQLPVKPINYEKFLPHLILFYWVYEKFPFIPYIHFVGGTATGKTTAMEVFGDLCYKAVDSTSSLTIASMFRIATQWKGTMLIDEFNNSGDQAKDLVTFLKAGVSNRLLYRVEGETKKELKAYVIKAPKIFTSETPIADAGLQSRVIVIKMEKNTRALPLYQLEEDLEECMHIRNKLLLWRLRNFNKIDLKKIKFGFEELKVFDRRVQQIITPVYYFSDKDTKVDILEFAKDQEDETLRMRKEAIDGVIFEILLEIWGGGEAQIKDICSRFNEEQKVKGYKEEYSEKRISNIIRKILGFDTERRGHDRFAWVIRNPEIEANRREYYGISPLEVTPQPPQQPQNYNEVEEKEIPF